MRLILIRHGDPDYVHDNLTEKGVREAELLARRTARWKVDDVYTSPLGRAVATAQPSLKAWKKTAAVLDWAQEFYYPIPDGKGGERIPWDFYPHEWTANERYFRKNEWVEDGQMLSLRPKYEWVCSSLDRFLLGYGLERNGNYYTVREHCDKTVVIFCHFGVSMIFLSHLLNLPAQALLHGLFLAPTSVSVLNTEERLDKEAYFRAERLGDTAHLKEGGEPVSSSGYFASVMQEI